MPAIRRVLALLLLGLGSAASAVEIYPLDEVRPGLRGEGLTVFQGDSISTFAVEILDRIPGRAPFDLILVRAEGEWAERSGVSQGMSGSPIYVEGRWLGAMAYNFGFAREPLALVTPAAAMLDLAQRGGADRADAGGACRELGFLAQEPRPASRGYALSPALAIGGVTPSGLEQLRDELAATGLTLIPMGAGAVTGSAAAPAGDAPGRALRPGDALAVELLRGPIAAAAFGTVSDVAGDRVWAFGHPFLDEGPVALPLAGAWVHGVIPSLASSFKLASVTGPLGSTEQDGKAGVLGRLGREAPMLPLSVVLTEDGVRSRRAEFELARHRRLQPVMARMAIQGWLQGPLSLQDEGRLTMRVDLYPDRGANGGFPRRATIAETFAGGDALLSPGLWLQSVVEALTMNPAGPLPLDSLRVSLDWREAEQPLLLESVRLDRRRVSAGDSLVLRLRLHQGAQTRAEVWTLPVGDLPPGDYQLHLADGGSFTAWNALRQPELFRFADHRALLRVLERLEPSDRWCLWISAPGRDRVIGDEELSLPVSIATLMPAPARENDKKTGRRLLRRDTRPAADGGAARGFDVQTFTVVSSPKRSRSEP
jgi:hypothetical protein